MTNPLHSHIFSVDGLPGFEQAILATYPESIVQRCIIHQIRYSTKYVNYKHRKELINDLKSVYKAANEEEGYRMLEEFEEKREKYIQHALNHGKIIGM